MDTKKNNSLTSTWIEEGLFRMKEEANPYWYGSNFEIGIENSKPETIGDMMERWSESLADSKLTNQIFDSLKNDYLKTLESGATKLQLIEDLIKKYETHKLNKLAGNFKEGYINKGYQWYEKNYNFSLKDFVLHHPETISCEFEATSNLDLMVTETFIENSPRQEKYFKYACEGWVYAKFVDFLNNELNLAKQNVSPENSIQFIEITLQDRLVSIENRAAREWKDSKIRCAAFCEMLWDKKYFVEKKKRIKTCNDFAKSRYGMDIEISLSSGKEISRHRHKSNTVNKKPPLKNLFE